MNSGKKKENIQPRTGETHGLFGIRFLKYHNIRDPNWTAEDLITQYEKLSNICRKANRVAELQEQQDEVKIVELYNRMKEEIKTEQKKLNVLLKGDVQRTKNILQDNLKYQLVYKNKQSYELLEELGQQAFLKRKMLDRCICERRNLVKKYEDNLMEAALKQEVIRYYDIKEFKQERITKQLSVEVKNSETRTRAIQKKNSTNKKIIGQLLRDSLYYQPVLEALSADWKEQTKLVQQTYSIGHPAMQNAKKLVKDLAKLQKVTKKEENMQQKTVFKSLQILEGYPKEIKSLVRRESDFSLLGDRYERRTRSMMNLKIQTDDVESTLKMFKEATLSRKYEEIFDLMQLQPVFNDRIKNQVKERQKIHDAYAQNDELIRFVTEILLDDLPQNDEKQRESFKLENAIKEQEKKKMSYDEQKKKCGQLMAVLRFGLNHIVDVLRHVQSADFLCSIEYPTIDLKLPLLKDNLPDVPKTIETNASKILDTLKTVTVNLMQTYQKEESSNNLNTSNLQYRQAIRDASMPTFT